MIYFWRLCILQRVSGRVRPSVDEALEPLASVALLQQRWQDHLQQQQLQGQLADRGIAAETQSTSAASEQRVAVDRATCASVPVQHYVVRKEGWEKQFDDPDWKPKHQQDDGSKHNLQKDRGGHSTGQ